MKQYSDKEFEKEVQERVNFKLQEIQDAINAEVNRAKHLIGYANSVSAFLRMNEIFNKEKSLPVPYDEMYRERKQKQKNIAVDKIMQRFESIMQGQIDSRELPRIASLIAKSIEKAQI